jgi:hypothetical protein
MIWKDGRLVSAKIKSDRNGLCPVSYAGKTAEFKIKKNKALLLDGNLSEMTVANQSMK